MEPLIYSPCSTFLATDNYTRLHALRHASIAIKCFNDSWLQDWLGKVYTNKYICMLINCIRTKKTFVLWPKTIRSRRGHCFWVFAAYQITIVIGQTLQSQRQLYALEHRGDWVQRRARPHSSGLDSRPNSRSSFAPKINVYDSGSAGGDNLRSGPLKYYFWLMGRLEKTKLPSACCGDWPHWCHAFLLQLIGHFLVVSSKLWEFFGMNVRVILRKMFGLFFGCFSNVAVLYTVL